MLLFIGIRVVYSICVNCETKRHEKINTVNWIFVYDILYIKFASFLEMFVLLDTKV